MRDQDEAPGGGVVDILRDLRQELARQVGIDAAGHDRRDDGAGPELVRRAAALRGLRPACFVAALLGSRFGDKLAFFGLAVEIGLAARALGKLREPLAGVAHEFPGGRGRGLGLTGGPLAEAAFTLLARFTCTVEGASAAAKATCSLARRICSRRLK